MKKRPTIPSRAAFFLAALSVFCLSAAAFDTATAAVLEGTHILDLTAGALGRIAALKVEQKVLIFPRAAADAPTVLDETAIYVMPQRFRSDIVSERIRRTHLEFADSALTVVDGRLSTDPDPLDRYQRLLRSRTRPALMRTLGAMGVEFVISSFGRFEEQVVYVVGAHYPDESVSQLAVDVDSFLPVRLLMVEDGRRLSVVFRSWRKLQDGWFPYQVDFFQADSLVRQIRVTDVAINPSIPVSLMDLEALNAAVAAGGNDASEDSGTREAAEEVQQAVEAFQKKFE